MKCGFGPLLLKDLTEVPALALLVPRQCGKTTLARSLGAGIPGAVYLDLERPSDLRRLSDPELYLGSLSDQLVVLDEIQRVPNLFPVLRSLVDENRRPGRFLLLGSASRDLLRQSSESLAGRIRYRELTPFTLPELADESIPMELHWLRGGFPQCLLATSDDSSLRWRQEFLRTFLERDVPSFGVEVRPPLFERFVKMLAHLHGQILNWSRLAESAAVSVPTAKHYVELLEKSFLVRLLPPHEVIVGKRLVKSPNVWWRDAGLLHALLEIERFDDLQGHPVLGASWEGYSMEEILRAAPRAQPTFYRTQSGTELDLVLTQGSRQMVVEFKRSSAPEPAKGFWQGIGGLGILSSPRFSVTAASIP